MNSDPASLDNLRGIVELDPVSWWPMASGWWALGFFVLVVLAIVVYRTTQQWQASAYRRAALKELQSATNISDISTILKRTALVAFPRAEVAALAGSAWPDWLGDAVGEPVPAQISESLARGAFAKTNVTSLDEVSLYAAKWIHQHNHPRTATNASRRCP